MADPIAVAGADPPPPVAGGLGSVLGSAPVIGGLVSGGLSLLGGVLGNRSASRAARENRQWQEHMRATQYQTAVSDLKAAGLNPMLAYTQGGAGTPAGGAAVTRDVVSPSVASASATASAMASIANIQADTDNKRATADQIKAQTAVLLKEADVKHWLSRLTQHQGTSAWAEAQVGERSIESRVMRLASDALHSKYGLAGAKAEEEFYESVGSLPKFLSSAGDLGRLLPLFKILMRAK